MRELIYEAEVDTGEEGLAELGPGFCLLIRRELREEVCGGGAFAFARGAGEDELVGVGDGGLCGEEALGRELGLLADEGAVHEEEGLGGEVCDRSFADDEVGVGGVEDFEEIEHGVTKPGDVDAAAFGIEDIIEVVLSRVADGGSAAGGVELAADDEGRYRGWLQLQGVCDLRDRRGGLRGRGRGCFARRVGRCG